MRKSIFLMTVPLLFALILPFKALNLITPQLTGTVTRTGKNFTSEKPFRFIQSPATFDTISSQESSSLLYLPFIYKKWPGVSAASEWPTVAANPERTSWSSEKVTDDLHVEWYRPVEAYISQNTQIIAANGLLYISTARGLYALNAADGEIAWRFDTQLPLGNSPTVSKNVVYVGGYDHKLHALDALTGAHLWSFDQAQAGYSTNPLVVDGKVIAGNRDGVMYAIGAQGTPQQGKLIWKFQTGGPILLSAAYKQGVVYFASNDNYAYAINANNGEQIWKSEKLPGDGYQSYWPVIYQDKVIFSAASGYRQAADPGIMSLKDTNGNPYYILDNLQKDALFFDKPDGGDVGPVSASSNDSWAHGKDILDASRISEYLENNPDNNTWLHKPWRRTIIILNQTDGKEYTFDSDGDTYPEYAPIAWWGTRNGNRYPPIVGQDGLLYVNNIFSVASGKYSIPQGKIMGWKLGSPYFNIIGGQGAVDEPQAISGGGDILYRSICLDRVGDYFWTDEEGHRIVWDYNKKLSDLAPGYDEMWWGIDPNADLPREYANFGTRNGIYNSIGDVNPFIPYGGRLYIHRSNAIIAIGPGQQIGKLPLLRINPVQDEIQTPSLDTLKANLETEIGKIINAGHLRPGYYNPGEFAVVGNLVNYFDNPGDTLYTLSIAYPYLSNALQEKTRDYLKREYQTYFDPIPYARIGWADGAARESMPLPDDIKDAPSRIPKSTNTDPEWSWQYPPYNLYALWKYVQVIPEDSARAYELAKSKIEVPVPAKATNDYFVQYPYEQNAYIAGYIGFLKLQELAGKSAQDSDLKSKVTDELNRLLNLRSANFTKETARVATDSLPPEGGEAYHYRDLNISQNFIFLVPELGDYLNQQALVKVQFAVNEYNFVGPYWFVSRYNGAVDEAALQNLYDTSAMFQAKAYILKEPREELTKYLDVAAFERGDLFYIQDLVAAIEAGPH